MREHTTSVQQTGTILQASFTRWSTHQDVPDVQAVPLLSENVQDPPKLERCFVAAFQSQLCQKDETCQRSTTHEPVVVHHRDAFLDRLIVYKYLPINALVALLIILFTCYGVSLNMLLQKHHWILNIWLRVNSVVRWCLVDLTYGLTSKQAYS